MLIVLFLLYKTEKKYVEGVQCIGIITVDNYEEIIQMIPNEERPQIIAQIEKRLYDWAMQSNGLMIKTESFYIYLFYCI